MQGGSKGGGIVRKKIVKVGKKNVGGGLWSSGNVGPGGPEKELAGTQQINQKKETESKRGSQLAKEKSNL